MPRICAAESLVCFAKAHPDVPVVENLEDIWLVNRLQQERKARERELQQSAQQQQRREVNCVSFDSSGVIYSHTAMHIQGMSNSCLSTGKRLEHLLCILF